LRGWLWRRGVRGPKSEQAWDASLLGPRSIGQAWLSVNFNSVRNSVLYSVHVSHASHSRLLAPIAPSLTLAASALRIAGALPWYSVHQVTCFSWCLPSNLGYVSRRVGRRACHDGGSDWAGPPGGLMHADRPEDVLLWEESQGNCCAGCSGGVSKEKHKTWGGGVCASWMDILIDVGRERGPGGATPRTTGVWGCNPQKRDPRWLSLWTGIAHARDASCCSRLGKKDIRP
jgi:hypothetical protein